MSLVSDRSTRFSLLVFQHFSISYVDYQLDRFRFRLLYVGLPMILILRDLCFLLKLNKSWQKIQRHHMAEAETRTVLTEVNHATLNVCF